MAEVYLECGSRRHVPRVEEELGVYEDYKQWLRARIAIRSRLP